MKYCCIHAENQVDCRLDFVPDYRHDQTVPTLFFPEDYVAGSRVNLCCTQHSAVVDWSETISDHQRRTITNQWASFLASRHLPFKEVQFCTATPQKIFDAICTQSTIESLRIKWMKGKRIESIENLKNLRQLFIECGSCIEDITPIGKLEHLETLILGSTTKIRDYAAIGQLANLKNLIVCSYPIRSDIMVIEDDSFLSTLPRLRYLDLGDTKILRRHFLSASAAQKYDYAFFPLD